MPTKKSISFLFAGNFGVRILWILKSPSGWRRHEAVETIRRHISGKVAVQSIKTHQPRWCWNRRTPLRWRRSSRLRRRRRRRTSRSCSEQASRPSRSSRAAAGTGCRRTCAACCRSPPAAWRPFPPGARAGAAGDGRWPSRRRTERPPRGRRSAGGRNRLWSPSFGLQFSQRKRQKQHQIITEHRNRANRYESMWSETRISNPPHSAKWTCPRK